MGSRYDWACRRYTLEDLLVRRVNGHLRLGAIGHVLRLLLIITAVVAAFSISPALSVAAPTLLFMPSAKSMCALAGWFPADLYIFSGDGSDTARATAAEEAAYAVGGGRVLFGARAYTLQGVPWFQGVFHHGAGAGDYNGESEDRQPERGGTVFIAVDENDPTPLYDAQVTSEMYVSQRFTYGGFFDIGFDGTIYRNTSGIRAVSTYNLQTIPAIAVGTPDADGQLYVWLQQIHFERCVFHGLSFGIELWGDCRTVPVIGNRFYECDVGIYWAQNHPNLRWNSLRDCRINVDYSQALDVEIIGMTCSISDYGLGGPNNRLDRFGQKMSRIDRARISNCIFFQCRYRGARIGVQTQFIGNFIWVATSGAQPGEGPGLEVNGGGGSNVLGNFIISFVAYPCINVVTGTDGLAESVGCRIAQNNLSAAGGGRCIQKTDGTNDIQVADWSTNDYWITLEPTDGLGGAAILWAATAGNMDRPRIDRNNFRSQALQPDFMVKILSVTGKYSCCGNLWWSVPLVGQSKAFQANDSRGAIFKDNRIEDGFDSIDAVDFGLVDSNTVVRDNPGLAGNNKELGRFGWKSGRFYTTPGSVVAATPAEGALHATPLLAPFGEAIDQLVAEVTGAGAAGALIRMGAYRDDGEFYPGALLLDAGTIAATAVGFQAITLSPVLTKLGRVGMVWLAGVIQGAATTRPTMRCTSNTPLPGIGGSTAAVLNNAYNGYVAAGPVSGALPDPFPANQPAGVNMIRMAVRAV